MFQVTGLFFGIFLIAPASIIAAIYLTVRLNSRR
jgi:hypothetical protein